jgi:hypothetical protein
MDVLLQPTPQQIELHPNWTLLQLIQDFSPSADGNDPTHDAAFVG